MVTDEDKVEMIHDKRRTAEIKEPFGEGK